MPAGKIDQKEENSVDTVFLCTCKQLHQTRRQTSQMSTLTKNNCSYAAHKIEADKIPTR